MLTPKTPPALNTKRFPPPRSRSRTLIFITIRHWRNGATGPPSPLSGGRFCSLRSSSAARGPRGTAGLSAPRPDPLYWNPRPPPKPGPPPGLAPRAAYESRRPWLQGKRKRKEKYIQPPKKRQELRFGFFFKFFNFFFFVFPLVIFTKLSFFFCLALNSLFIAKAAGWGG